MKYNEFKTLVIAEAQRLGLSDYELYYSESNSTSVVIFQHEIKDFDSSVGGGVSFRCLKDGRMGYASTEDLSAQEALRIVRAALDNAAVLETVEQEFLGEGGKSYQPTTQKEIALPSAEALTKKALEAQEALYAADSLVIDGSATELVAMQNTLAIANSRGLDLFHENKAVVLFSSAVVSDGKEMNNSYEIAFGALEELDLEKTARTAVSDAKSQLGADVAPTGAYPVVFAPKAMTGLLQAFSGVFSAENARKGLSRLRDREGERIAAEVFTLIDDPFYAENPAQMPFDAEGTPSFTKAIIEQGEFKTLLHNLKSAAAMDKQSTGNASKSSYSAPVGVSPFTLRVAPGTMSEEELLQKAGNGVYIDFLGGLHAGADPISGDFSLQSAGFMIENGQKTRAVKSFTVAGNFYDLLQGVAAVADNVKFISFGSPTAFASPSVLVEGLSLAGK